MTDLLKNSNKEVLDNLTDTEKLRWQRVIDDSTDFKQFCIDYFPEHFRAAFSEYHDELFEQIETAIENNVVDNIADAAPRGFAKSTIISFALPIWCALYQKKHYIILISDTADQANDFLTNIRNEFEENEMLIEDFGYQEGAVWTNSDIILKNSVRIQALGAGKKIRGRRYRQYRPDLIIGDDLENDENIASVDQRKKMMNWWTKAVSKAGDERTDKIVIGTIIHYDSLLNKLLKNPVYQTKKYQAVISWSDSNLWHDWERLVVNLEDKQRLQTARAFYEEHKDEMTAGTKVIWSAKEDYYNLMLQRVADGPAAFSSEKMNEPLSDEDRRFSPEWIQYYDFEQLKGKKLFVSGFVDPSMGKKGGDYSAIIVLGKETTGQIYVLDADIARRHPDVIMTDVVRLHRLYHFNIFGVEENQFQEYFKDTLTSKIKDEKIDLPVKGVRQHSDKILRIQSLQPDIKNGIIKFRRNQQTLIEQLINFPEADNDDGPDALEGALSLFTRQSVVAQYYESKINEFNQKSPQSVLQQLSHQGHL